MFAHKRSKSVAVSGKNKQAKHTGSPAARASKAVPLQPGAAVFLPKAPAAVFSGPVIVAFTLVEGRPV